MKSDRYRKGVPPAFPDSQPKYIQDELTKLERVLDLNYDDVKQVTQDGATLKAAFDEEVILRVTNDEALSQKITKLTSTVDEDRANTNASLLVEQTARATKDTALSQQITDLTSTVTTNNSNLNARVYAEETARANGDTALATRIDSLTSTFTDANNTLTASINSEANTRASVDSALSTRIDTVSATASSKNKVHLQSTAPTGTLTEGDVWIDTGNNNVIKRWSGTAWDDVSDSRIAANAAAITTEHNARVEGDTANADLITSLTTAVNGHTTTISQHTSSINGLTAKWGVKVNNNNRVAGIMLNSDSTGTSSFDIEANYVNVYEPGTNNKKLYWDGSSLVVRGDILATSITTSSVNNLGSNAISRPVVGMPNIIASGSYATSQDAGYLQHFDPNTSQWVGSYVGFVVYIDTGINVNSNWSTASTDQYLATATISGGSANLGGFNGYSKVELLVGDGILSNQSLNNPIDNRIYIRYEFIPPSSGSGSINVTSISWKLARI